MFYMLLQCDEASNNKSFSSGSRPGSATSNKGGKDSPSTVKGKLILLSGNISCDIDFSYFSENIRVDSIDKKVCQ